MNQNESVTANAIAPIAPPALALTRWAGVQASGCPFQIRTSRTITRCVSRTVAALHSTDTRLTANAMGSGDTPENSGAAIANSRPTSM